MHGWKWNKEDKLIFAGITVVGVILAIFLFFYITQPSKDVDQDPSCTAIQGSPGQICEGGLE